MDNNKSRNEMQKPNETSDDKIKYLAGDLNFEDM